ncbi:MAG: polymer-forming cytoskeletal protein [Magnetococcales bacterium]|nr:polymer-forming cytoskeletal protein [Magnetococcales bacterium]
MFFLGKKNREVQHGANRSEEVTLTPGPGDQTPALLPTPPVDTTAGTTTLIAFGTQIRGEIELSGRLQVDGRIEGRILAEGVVVIGRSGQIEGEIRARKLVASGSFHGQAECDEVEILAGGNVTGQVSSMVMVVERGSFFEGESRLKESATAPLPPPPVAAAEVASPPASTPAPKASEAPSPPASPATGAAPTAAPAAAPQQGTAAPAEAKTRKGTTDTPAATTTPVAPAPTQAADTLVKPDPAPVRPETPYASADLLGDVSRAPGKK